ncbi:nucleotide exchange factor GrpE, partial [bacterium]|nr:nucleotide exchange factor GrpE [bacterium]
KGKASEEKSASDGAEGKKASAASETEETSAGAGDEKPPAETGDKTPEGPAEEAPPAPSGEAEPEEKGTAAEEDKAPSGPEGEKTQAEDEKPPAEQEKKAEDVKKPASEDKTPDEKPAPEQVPEDKAAPEPSDQTGAAGEDQTQPAPEVGPAPEAGPEPQPDGEGHKKTKAHEKASKPHFEAQLVIARIKDLNETHENELESEENDQHDVDEELDWVNSMIDKIPGEVQKLQADFEKTLNDSLPEADLESVNDELKTNLVNRQESLDLCLKMLQRVDRVFPQFESKQEKMKELPALKNKRWVIEERELKKLTEQELTDKENQLKDNFQEVRDFNYHAVRQKKELYDSLLNSFLDFFKKYYLPIVDGIVDGRRYYQESQTVWLEKFADNAALIEKRFGIYETLLDLSKSFLNSFHISLIPVEPGDEFDENVHEPVDVEADKSMKNNQLKTVNRLGFEFVDPDTKKQYIIRSPQVTVVKNS